MTTELTGSRPDPGPRPVPARSALEDGFPAALLSELGLKESWRKEVHRPATSTHKWWAKRLGSVFRGILASAVAESGEQAVDLYSNPSGLDGLVVLDPFAGSGVTGVEAIKMGARAVCFDINPVATLVQRQAVAPWDLDALEKAYRAVEEACRDEIDRVHRTSDGRDVLYYFWVVVAACPECGQEVHLFDDPVFSRNAYPKRVPRAQIVCPECLDLQTGRYDFERAVCARGHRISRHGPVGRSRMTCWSGHTSGIIDALGGRRPRHRMYAKLVLNPDGSKSYEPVSAWDRDLYAECTDLLRSLPHSSVLPSGSLDEGNNTRQALNWNFREWPDFFNDRQLYSLALLASAVRDVPTVGPEREALCALFSGTLEFNNLFASFKGEGTGAVRHMFAHHILKPERTPLEAHPWGTPHSSGSFSTLFRSRLLRAHSYKTQPHDLVLRGGTVERVTGLSTALEHGIHEDWSSFDAERGAAYVATRNAARTDLPARSVDIVVTDPPYMDNVYYSELADFFHAWLRNMQPFPSYGTASSTRSPGEVQRSDPAEFGAAIGQVWAECHRVLKDDGILAFTFHQARLSGWVELVKSVANAGLAITAVQPVKGEMSSSVVKAGSREPSNLDSVVVCRKLAGRDLETLRPVGEAFDGAVHSLRELLDQGVVVGRGDVRSVVRGSVLPHVDLADPRAVRRVDEMADEAIATLLG